MNIVNQLKEYKALIGVVLVTIGMVISFIAWAEEQKQVVQAKHNLIMDENYQERRIERKQDEMREDNRELATLLSIKEPNSRELRQVLYLDSEVARLKVEIEAIRVIINTSNE